MRKFLLFMLCTLMAAGHLFAQGKTVTGKVTDENGAGLAGASVSAVGASANAMTNSEGSFTISVPARVKELTISYVGYATQTIAIGTQSSITIKLAPGSAKLDEVVVTGINRVQRSKYTGAATKMDQKVIENRPVGSFDQLFQGRIPGVLALTGSGQPGAASTVIIRGTSSITGGSDPLYVVDGIPVEVGVFQSLNTNDFESIDILRDAAATAKYGSRASAGVIVVTTRKGRSGKMQLQYQGQAGVKNRPNFTWDMMTSPELLKAQEDYGRILGLANDPTTLQNIPGWYYSPNNPAYQFLSPTEQAQYRKSLDSLRSINTDWRDIFLKKGGFNNNQISVSGGSGKTRMYSSLAYYHEEGTTLRTDMDRWTWRNNVDYADDRFTLSVQSNFGVTKRNFQQSTQTNSLGNPFLAMNINVPYAQLVNNDGTLQTGTGAKFAAARTYELTTMDANNSNQLKGIISTTASYKLTSDVNLGLTAGADFRETQTTNYGDRRAFARRTSASPTGRAGFQSEGLSRFLMLDIRPSIEYHKMFGQKSDFNATLYGEYIGQRAKSINMTGYGIDPRTPNTPAAITQGNQANLLFASVGGGKGVNTLFSGLLDMRYTYDGKYTFTVSYRRDGSSKLAEANRWKGFYAVGAVWDATKESFLRGNSTVNTMRVKMSYGSAGNSENFPGGDYPYQSTYAASGNYAGLPVQVATYPGNPDMKWETTYTTNFGVDFGFFRNRIYGDFNWYDKRTKDLFVEKRLSAVSGFNTLIVNAGELQNRGVEVTLNAEVVRTRELVWTVNGNFALNRNKVLSLGGESSFEQGTELITVGMPLGSHYEVKWGGVDAATGAPLYYDINGKLTTKYDAQAAVQQFGTWEAPWKGGFGTSLRYNSSSVGTFEISTVFSWQRGANKVNNLQYFMENPVGFLANGYNQANTLKFWQNPGDVVNTPSPLYGVNFSSKIIQNADFLRWRDLMVTYTLPAKVISKLKVISAMSVYLQGQNLAIWTKWQGMDPEAGATNINLSEFPNPRAITGGINITFK